MSESNREELTDILIERYQVGDLEDKDIGSLIDGLLVRLEWAMPKAHAFDSEIKSRARNELRDYFAAKVMQSLIINPATISSGVPLSARAYEVADAMLAAREKQQ